MPRPLAFRGHYQPNNLHTPVPYTAKTLIPVPQISMCIKIIFSHTNSIYQSRYYFSLRHQCFSPSEITVLNKGTSPFVHFKWNILKTEP